MPNHIKNLVTFAGEDARVEEIKKFVASETSVFDFNKIIQMPVCLQEFQPHSGILSRADNALGTNLDDNELIASLEKGNRIRDCFTPIDSEDIEDVIKAMRNFLECGYTYWRDWSLEKWGTKWNCYGINSTEEGVSFDTAYSHPKLIFKTLSSLFPDVDVCVEYADEDTGSNCGTVTYSKGGIKTEDIAGRWGESSSADRRKWVAFALRVNGCAETVDDYLDEIEAH